METNMLLKRKTALVATVGIIIAFIPLTTISASTAGVKDPTSLESLSDTDKVLVMPDGAILNGTISVKSNSLLDKAIPSINSATNPNAITWGELKKETKTSNNNLSKVFSSKKLVDRNNLRGSSPATQHWTLEAGKYYSSNAFSGSGWRFGGYIFETPPVAADYLLWGSHGDAGRVGNYNDAMNTWNNGGNYGIQINNGAQAYFEGPAQYYSYNPKSGSYYGVANR